MLKQHTNREIAEKKFQGSEATESLLITLNDGFDVMNARIPKK